MQEVIGVLGGARSLSDYNRAKRLASRLPTREQFALVDHFIAAHKRLIGSAK